MQVASQIFPFFEIPNWAVRLVVLLLIIGFPIALIIAWAFETTPEGIKRTEVADAAGQRSRGGAWIYIVLIGVALSVGLFFVGRYTAGHGTSQVPEVTTASHGKSIAVLPLINESGDPKDEYFSDGLSEELIAALAQISGLKVIGRSSSFRFLRRNLEDYRKAVGYFDQAIRRDPDYALAYAERSEAWTFIGDLTGQREPAWSKARSDAERAVAIAPALAEARAALGWVRFFVDWKFTEGLSELKRAKEFSPSNPTANDLLARVILYLGRLDEAERQARHAVELDPLSVIAQGNLARVLLFAGKLDEADAAARKAAELQPTSASSHRWQVVVAVLRGDGATALREAQLEPDEGYRRFELALAQQIQGDRQAADAALADLIANGRDQLAYQIAEVYAVRGEKDKAFEWLQIAFDEHDTGTLTLLVDPLLRGLRDDSRYKNLLAKLGLPGSS